MESGQSEFLKYYDQYFQKVYGFVYRRVLSREIAEDLTSEIFIKALRKWPGEEKVSGAWIFMIARNRIIDHYRTNKNNDDIETVFDLAGPINPLTEVANRESLEKIKTAMGYLSSKQRQIVMMRLWDELSYKEIAESVGQSEAAVKMICLRSLKALRSHLPEKDFLALIIGLIIIK